MLTTPLANGKHAGVRQILFRDPGQLLCDGRIIHFLSRLCTSSGSGEHAWELRFTSEDSPQGPQLQARLIVHTMVDAHARPRLKAMTAASLETLLEALRDNDLEAEELDEPLPALIRADFISLYKGSRALLDAAAEIRSGHLRQHLCQRAGNGFSLILVQSRWAEGELKGCVADGNAARLAMLAHDPVFDFIAGFWGPDAKGNARWLCDLTLNGLKPFRPVSRAPFSLCMQRDPWYALTLVPDAPYRTTLLTLSELLTMCGCTAEPGEMQRMCRMTWRQAAEAAMSRLHENLLTMDVSLHAEDLRYMGLSSEADLTDVLHMTEEQCDMLRLSVSILRELGTLLRPGEHRAAPVNERQERMTSLMLPTVGHIYEQLVRDCCYDAMLAPYHAYACGGDAPSVNRTFLSAYDQGPGTTHYRLACLDPADSRPAQQNQIRERMIDDFTQYASIDHKLRDDAYWYTLFNDMATARTQRNGLTHEHSDIKSAERFAMAFLLDQPGSPSLLRRLLKCQQITTAFPVPQAAAMQNPAEMLR